jgi:hypothetical protein
METDIRAAAAAVTADSADSRIMRLQLWLEENGASIRSLEVKEVDGLRGVHATAPVTDGELIIHVPRKLILTAEVAKESWSGKVIAAMGGRPSDYGYMAAFLLETQRESGFWKPYVDTLPECLDHIPALFNEEELAYMTGSYTERMAKNTREWVDWDFDHYNKAMPRSLQVTRKEFAWARCAVMSRVYNARIDGRKTVAMVPVADMFNHSTRPTATWTTDMSQGFVVTARVPMATGDAVFETYGTRCNGTLFNVYGFVLDPNNANRAEVLLPDLPPNNPLYQRVRHLGVEVEASRGFQLPTCYDEEVVQPLFTRLRLEATQPSQRGTRAGQAGRGMPRGARTLHHHARGG